MQQPDVHVIVVVHETVRKQESLTESFMKACRAMRAMAKEMPRPLRPGVTIRRTDEPIGRNEPCRCGSGKKFKHCCRKQTSISSEE